MTIESNTSNFYPKDYYSVPDTTHYVVSSTSKFLRHRSSLPTLLLTKSGLRSEDCPGTSVDNEDIAPILIPKLLFSCSSLVTMAYIGLTSVCPTLQFRSQMRISDTPLTSAPTSSSMMYTWKLNLSATALAAPHVSRHLVVCVQ